MNVAYLTDSLPPILDGVGRCVLESAKTFMRDGHGQCIVVAPHIPRSKGIEYPFPVFRFPTLGIPKMEYRAGYPFVPSLVKKFKEYNIEIIHAHSPFIAMSVARQIRGKLHIPIVYTQHTKWEFDIARAIPSKTVRKAAEKFVYKNINAADEVWTVSGKTGEHIKSRGFKGEYLVMENGTDFLRTDVDENLFAEINAKYELEENVPFLLFVGRMMWYKNQKVIFDALEILKSRNFKFKMCLIGDGRDIDDMKKMIQDKNLHSQVFFVGKVSDRELLRAYYTRADMFVFPSTYDNAPLVLREAAAGSCPSLVIRGSSAAEIIEENVTGFYSDENCESVAENIIKAFGDKNLYEYVKTNAAERVYLPWSKVIDSSVARYGEVIKAYKIKLAEKGKKGK